MTGDELRQARNRLESEIKKRGLAVNYTKTQVNAALDAVEARLELASTQTAINSDIETAAPGVFTGTQKRLIFALAALRTALGEGF